LLLLLLLLLLLSCGLWLCHTCRRVLAMAPAADAGSDASDSSAAIASGCVHKSAQLLAAVLSLH
jgi:hypothetical protein